MNEKQKKMKITFIDLFCGIGGFRLGMEMAGHICLGHCEIDKFAKKSYTAMHNIKKGEWYAEDITKVRAGEMPKADCWCFGFPCQNISIAGAKEGLQGEQSGLFFEVIRILRETEKENRPEWLFIENVRNLLLKKDLILQGYSLHWTKSGMMHNGKCLTVPILECHNIEKGSILLDILEENPDKKYFLSLQKHNQKG